jgi:hypothetical protein
MRPDPVNGCMYAHIWIDAVEEEYLERDERSGLHVAVERRRRLKAPARCLQASAGEVWQELHQHRGADLRPWQPFRPPAALAELKHLAETCGGPVVAAWLARQMKADSQEPNRGPVPITREDDPYPFIQLSRKVQVVLKVDPTPLVARHCSGEQLADYAKLGPDELHAPVCFGQAVVNSAALHDNYGLIRSRFDVSEQTGRTGEYVEVVSYLPGPGRPVECAVYCSRD